LFFPDPIDENRNIMASLSERNFLKTFIASKAFFKSKKVEDFFFFDHSKFKVYEKALSIKFEKPDVVEDIRFGVLKRIARACVNKLNEHGINVKDYYVYQEKEDEKAYDYISFTFFDEKPIKHKLIRSPPIYMKEYLKSFVEKHEKDGLLKFSKDGVVVVKEMPYKSVRAIIRNFLSSYKMKFYKNNAYKIVNVLTHHLERELALEKFLLGGLNDNTKSG
jgi:tRNA nucleotidyltransferase (CCA-adding enzyme)